MKISVSDVNGKANREWTIILSDKEVCEFITYTLKLGEKETKVSPTEALFVLLTTPLHAFDAMIEECRRVSGYTQPILFFELIKERKRLGPSDNL